MNGMTTTDGPVYFYQERGSGIWHNRPHAIDAGKYHAVRVCVAMPEDTDESLLCRVCWPLPGDTFRVTTETTVTAE